MNNVYVEGIIFPLGRILCHIGGMIILGCIWGLEVFAGWL